jgi:hypothetical protein
MPSLGPSRARVLDSAVVAEFDARQLERALGPDWQTMSYVQVATRARVLETSANFARRLVVYMDETGTETPGEALATLAARAANQPPTAL